MKLFTLMVGLCCLGGTVFAQRAHVRDVSQSDMPSQADSNNPAFWRDGWVHVMNSTGGNPSILSAGPDQFHMNVVATVNFRPVNPWPAWFEAMWTDSSGAILAWYHQEHWGLCKGSRLAVPQIGAAVSFDGGANFQDLGPVITSGDGYSCSAQNGYFAGGVGDFSVVLDRNRQFFYFLFSNYAGPVETQGIAIARLPFANRFNPAGMVTKYWNGEWSQPGIGGRVSPIFPAKVSWMSADTDSYWGPSVHWNTYLNSYVMLLNRSCCTTGFPQQYIYASFGAHLSDPASWTAPKSILKDTGWYPQVLGTGAQGTDTVAGRIARLYIQGHSRWEIVFEKPTDPPTPPQ